MTELDRLEDELKAEYDLTIEYRRIANQDGVVLVEKGKKPYIAVDKRLDDRKRTAVAYHEAGHLKYGITRRTRKDELRAERWSFHRLIKLDALIQGIKKCPGTVNELAEYMKVDEGLLRRYFTYKARTKVYEEHGDYVISYCPVILLNWRTGEMWPEE